MRKLFLLKVGWRLSLVAALLTCSFAELKAQDTVKKYPVYTNTWGDVTIEAPDSIEEGGTLTYITDGVGQYGVSEHYSGDRLDSDHQGNGKVVISNVEAPVLISVTGSETHVVDGVTYRMGINSNYGGYTNIAEEPDSPIVELKSTIQINGITYGIDSYEGCFNQYAKVTTLILPNSSMYFYRNTINNQSGLETIYAKALDPALYQEIELAFGEKDLSNVTLYVPKGCKDVYAQSAFGQLFGENIQEEETAPTKFNVYMLGPGIASYTPTEITKGESLSVDFELEDGYVNFGFPRPVDNVNSDQLINLDISNKRFTENGLTYRLFDFRSDACLEQANVASDIEELVIPEYITSDEGYTYMVVEISPSVFANLTNLKKLTLGIGGQSVFPEAFLGCTAIEEIHCTSKWPAEYANYAFDKSIMNSCVVYVPKGCVEVYKNSDWSMFGTIVEEGTTEIEHTVTYKLTNLSFASKEDSIMSVARGDSLTFTLVPDSAYRLPDSIAVNGAEVFSYNDTTGLVSIPSVMASLTITAAAIPLADTIRTDETLEGEVGEIPIAAESEDSITVKISSVNSEKLSVSAGSNVTLALSGTNDLGTVTNDGTLVIQKEESATMTATAITNNGILRDSTGLVTSVEGSAALEISPISISTGNDDETTEGTTTVEEGEVVTLIASAEIVEGSSVDFQWQRLEEDVWSDVQKPTARLAKVMTRASAAHQKITDELVVSFDETGEYQYRCLITRTVTKEETEEGEGSQAKTISTTLATYATVTVESSEPDPEPNPDPEPEPDPEPTPDPTPDPTPTPDPDPIQYGVSALPCSGAEIKLSAQFVEEGGTLTFTIEIEEGYVADDLMVTVSQGIGKAVEVEPDEEGIYTVKNVDGLVTITIYGVEEATPVGVENIEGVQVYSHEDAIYVYTPTEAHVMIVAMNGVLKASEEQIGKRRYELPRGFYVVWVEGESFKVAN